MPAEQATSEYDMLCTRKGGAKTPYLPISACKGMAVWKKNATRSCRGCAGITLRRNPYNMENDCKAGLMPNLCYDVVGDIKAYLDRPDVREVGTDRPCEP
ncbi:hypothetical protein CF336_g5429 [Tilletia laevis]|uniref:Uncharacterized protein n=1 Tax=Tilletia caries TaxID=13290 RepID=A0A8T8T6L2_9BASI|nr:hypothetical protein CF336_g5429 [Tilletia laevis]KAE8256858.1 hypothetical protein A4X03_0g4987 [Tilletia caries]